MNRLLLCFVVTMFARPELRGESTIQTVALTGQQVRPGTTVFGSFDGRNTFREPVINDDGQVVFLAATSDGNALLHYGKDGIKVVAHSGSPIPNSEEVWGIGGNGIPAFAHLHLGPDGTLAFATYGFGWRHKDGRFENFGLDGGFSVFTLKRNDHMLYTRYGETNVGLFEWNGTDQTIAQPGMQPPGVPADFRFSEIGFGTPAKGVAATGDFTAFIASVSNQSISYSGLWLRDAASLHAIAVAGQTASGSSDKFLSFDEASVAVSAAGHVFFRAAQGDPVGNKVTKQAAWFWAGGALQEVRDAPHGAASITADGRLILNNNGSLWQGTPQDLKNVERLKVGGRDFVPSQGPFIGPNGHIVAFGELSPAGGSGAATTALVAGPIDGLSLLLSGDQPIEVAPGDFRTPEQIILWPGAGADMNGTASPINARNQVVFIAFFPQVVAVRGPTQGVFVAAYAPPPPVAQPPADPPPSSAPGASLDVPAADAAAANPSAAPVDTEAALACPASAGLLTFAMMTGWFVARSRRVAS